MPDLTRVRQSLARRYRDWTELRADGTPKLSVLLWFPILLLIAGVALVGLSINGSSSGAFYSQIHSGSDPALLQGTPEQIRSDEWNVGIVWTISQLQRGLPARNETFPGGMDAELPFGLPHRQLSVIVEPQLWGFLFLDADHGVAWKWWFPGLSLIAASYLLILMLNPKRPTIAAVLSVGFFFSPFFQWWYQTSTLWPVTWGALTIAGMVAAIRSRSARSRWLWAIGVSFLTAVMGIGIYAPFIIPVVLVVLFFGIGLATQSVRSGMKVRELVRRLWPTLIAGLVGASVIGIWLAFKADTVSGFLNTVYPGQRLTPTGSGTVISLARTIGSSFSESLLTSGGFLGINSSEASTFFLMGVFLLPAAAWAIIRVAKKATVLPWTTIALAVALIVFLAFMFLPGWDALARILFLDRTTSDRLRIGIGFASFVLVGCVIRDLDASLERVPRTIAWITGGVFLVSQIAIGGAVWFVQGPDKLWGSAWNWWIIAIVSTVAIAAVARRHFVVGTAGFLVVALASSAAVNPIYIGVLDLRETRVSQAIVKLDTGKPAAWVGIGGPLVTGLLLESGVEAYNGTQGAPSKKMWDAVDPHHKYNNEWNRIGGVIWGAGAGEPKVINPAPDVILATYDACSRFSKDFVGYVLSDDANLKSPCLAKVSAFALPHSTMTIFRVVK